MKRFTISLLLLAALATTGHAQFWKKKPGDAKDSTETVQEEKVEKKEKSGGGLFQKMIAKVSKGAAKMGGAMTGTTKSTADLDAVEPMVYFMNNLVSKEAGTMDQDFFNGWTKGGDFVGVMFLPKDKAFFYTIDGDVLFDGAKAAYQSTGLYTQAYASPKPARVLELQTGSGQKAKFTLQARKNPIKLVSVNGKFAGAEVDMTKDFTIQLQNFSTAPGSLIKLQITGQTIGLRAWYDLGYFKPAASVTIPGYIIKHAAAKGINFKNTFLQVSDAELLQAKDEAGHYKEPLRYWSGASSALPVKVVNEQKLFDGFTVKDERKLPAGKMTVEFTKPNATSSMPFSMATKIAASTFAVKGTTYYYDHKESKFLETRTTKTLEFPQIPEAKLDDILQKLYTGVTAILKEELNATILPAETVAATKEFADMAPFTNADQNTDEHFSKAYKGLRPMAMIVPLATTFKGESALFKAAGATALLKVVLNLQVSWDDKPIMQPILDVELLGPKNGGDLGLLPTKFFTAKLTGEGYKIKGKKEVTDAVIDEIVRMDDLLTALRIGLQDLKAKEKAQGEYGPIWELQR